MIIYSKEECELWFLNKTVNPITKRPITLNGKTYKEFECHYKLWRCGVQTVTFPQFQKEQIQLLSPIELSDEVIEFINKMLTFILIDIMSDVTDDSVMVLIEIQNLITNLCNVSKTEIDEYILVFDIEVVKTIIKYTSFRGIICCYISDACATYLSKFLQKLVFDLVNGIDTNQTLISYCNFVFVRLISPKEFVEMMKDFPLEISKTSISTEDDEPVDITNGNNLLPYSSDEIKNTEKFDLFCEYVYKRFDLSKIGNVKYNIFWYLKQYISEKDFLNAFDKKRKGHFIHKSFSQVST